MVHGDYNYKGWTIWSLSDKEWIAEPNWSIKAIENFNIKDLKYYETIDEAKKWISEVGVYLNEKDFSITGF